MPPSLSQSIIGIFNDVRPLIPMYLHLILSALFPIYIGAHASLSRPSSAAKGDKEEKKSLHPDDGDEDDDAIQKMEGLSPQDAIVFPVTAGIVLAGLYFLIKRYGADLINSVLGWYFSGVGVYSVAKLINDTVVLATGVCLPNYYGREAKAWRVDGEKRKSIALDVGEDTDETNDRAGPFLPDLPFVRDGVWSLRAVLKQKYRTQAYIRYVLDFKANISIVGAASAVIGLAVVAYANLVEKLWWLTNLQGFAVCYVALQLMSPTTFSTGSLILGGLFCYDIWAVFFTPLMVTVAKNLDQPIKLVFPRPEEPSEIPGEPPVRSFSMLGLGDIVLPGLMVCLALRFDLYMYYLRKQRTLVKHSSDAPDGDQEVTQKAAYIPVTGHWGDRYWTTALPVSVRPAQLNTAFPKPYFTASVAGYVVGMVVTLGIMSVAQHAQPALLYLVPSVLTGLWGAGAVRGELKEMWEYDEKLDDEDAKDDKPNETEPGITRPWLREFWQELVGASKDGNEEKTEADGSTLKEKKVGNDNPEKDKRSEDDGLLASFSVRRCNPRAFLSSKAAAAPQASALGGESTDLDTSGKTPSAPSDANSDNPVLGGSSSDLHGNDERQLRSRVVSKA